MALQCSVSANLLYLLPLFHWKIYVHQHSIALYSRVPQSVNPFHKSLAMSAKSTFQTLPAEIPFNLYDHLLPIFRHDHVDGKLEPYGTCFQIHPPPLDRHRIMQYMWFGFLPDREVFVEVIGDRVMIRTSVLPDSDTDDIYI